MTTNIKFMRQTGPYRTGECAGFPDDVATRLVAAGAAEIFKAQPHPDNDYRASGQLMPDTLDRKLPPASASARELEPVTEAAAAPPVERKVPRGGRLGDAARAAEIAANP